MGKHKTFLKRLQAIDCTLQGIIDVCDAEPVSPYTEFNVSSATGNACITPDLTPFDLTLWHDGEGEYPAIGDTVYSDAQGEVLFTTEVNQDHELPNGTYLACDGNGIRVDIVCK